MTDKELTIAAAKAAGMKGRWQTRTLAQFEGFYPTGFLNPWIPLSRSDHAFDLAVRANVGLIVDTTTHQSAACVEGGPYTTVPHDGDPTGATRRAIVLAVAASIVKDDQT